MNYSNKLDKVIEIAKNYGAPVRFLRLSDRPGWSDGFIADFNSAHAEVMEAKTRIKGNEVSDLKPAIEKLIPDGSHVVEDLEWDLSRNLVKLVNHSISAYVDPRFLKYFAKSEIKFDKLVLTDPLKAVKVISGNQLIGLIMPVRV